MVALSCRARPRAFRRRRAPRNHARLVAEAIARPRRTHDDAGVSRSVRPDATHKQTRIILIEAATPDVSSTDDSAARCAPARALTGSFPISSAPTLRIIVCIAETRLYGPPVPDPPWKTSLHGKDDKPTQTPSHSDDGGDAATAEADPGRDRRRARQEGHGLVVLDLRKAERSRTSS